MINIGNYVTRKKYGNDIIFKVVKIEDDKVILHGADLRLYADADYNDLQLVTISKKKERNIINVRELDKTDYFYIPGIILHLDSDEDYLEKCKNFYNDQKVKYYGYKSEEKKYENIVISLIKKHHPNIIVITGHDAYYKKNNSYKNSNYYIKSVKKIRSEYSNNDSLIIIAGACQSDFDNLIKSGATFASSPKRINIHALDPAIIATYIALTNKNEIINLDEILSKTKYKKDGFGGFEVYGTMKIGMPRKEIN